MMERCGSRCTDMKRAEVGGEVRGRLEFVAVVLCGAPSGLSMPAVFIGVHMGIEWGREGVEERDLDWDWDRVEDRCTEVALWA